MSASVVLLRRLGSRLRELRLAAGLSQEELADQVSMSTRTVMRAENASNAIGDRDLKRWLGVCGADVETRAQLIDLGKQCRRRGGWWSAYRDVLPGPYMQLEAEATEMRTYQPLLVPGLLQTEDYIRDAFPKAGITADLTGDVDRRLEARMKRQKRVRFGELAVHAVMDEAVLRQVSSDPNVVRDQLAHLVEMAGLPNVTVRVIPAGTGAYPSAGQSLVVLAFPYPVDPDIAMVETLAGEKLFEDAEEVATYNAAFDALGTRALSIEDSVKKIETVMAELSP